MAYMDKTRKAVIAAALKPVLAHWGITGSLSVRNHQVIVLTITAGPIDFVENWIACSGQQGLFTISEERRSEQHRLVRERCHIDVNPFYLDQHWSGDALEFLKAAKTALKAAGWYDRSDPHTDYFDTAYYIDIRIGRWDKPYRYRGVPSDRDRQTEGARV
jgi:hypothetical protein